MGDASKSSTPPTPEESTSAEERTATDAPLASCTAAERGDAPKVLVIGGTQFMGVHTVEALRAAGYAVTVVNRGVSPWPFGDDVARVRLDRFRDRDDLARVVSDGGWEAVVDFVAFSADDVAHVCRAALVPGSPPPPFYVFISSDSVYMACERRRIDAARAEGRSLDESDAVRETSRAGIAACRTRDAYQYRYGSGKLEAEEELGRMAERCGFPSTSLRLPDVIGPRDNLGGFLGLYERVARASVGCRVAGVADGAAHRASVAFAPDVAAAIVALLPLKRKPPVLHVACAETPTVAELVALVAEARGLDRPPKLDPGRRAPLLSVDVGPVDVSRALACLPGWRPTSLADAVRATCDWYTVEANAAYTRRLAEDSD